MVARFAKGELPDFGPPRVGSAGALAIGARSFLIALNVGLATDDVSSAQEIAKKVRTSGWREKNSLGRWTRIRGQLPTCQAIGWYVPEYKQAQVSMNLTDFTVTPPHVAYQAVQNEAGKLGVSVTGCELVGMIPIEALLSAGRAYCKKQGRQSANGQDELLAAAVGGLGLESHGPFNPEERIIELALESKGLRLS